MFYVVKKTELKNTKHLFIAENNYGVDFTGSLQMAYLYKSSLAAKRASGMFPGTKVVNERKADRLNKINHRNWNK